MARSDYYLSLGGDVKVRYEKKIEIIDNIDPYVLRDNELSFPVEKLPKIDMIDLVNYLILSHSYYTGLQLKAYKSLLAYKYYESGFVIQVLAKRGNDETFVVRGKVRHSQRSNEKPLQVWIIILNDSSISNAHCTCMAGLGEVCSHVAAVLFYLYARPEQTMACTEQLAIWPIPSTKNVDMMRIRDMDWHKETKIIIPQPHNSATPLTKTELCDLLWKLKELNISPAICRLVEPFASDLMESESTNLPASLGNLYSEEFSTKSYEELVEISKNIDIQLSEEEVTIVEETTRDQSQNETWFKYRTGRITASHFKSVCRTSIQKPSLTVIEGVCYPQKVIFNSKQTTYGTRNEKNALKSYKDIAEKQHMNFTLSNSGFFISIKHPQLGASPDGLIYCDCCGLGCVEVKCPYLLSGNLTLEEFAKKKSSCLIYNDGTYALDRSHCYFYQVQLQMFVTNCNFCDFVVWSKNITFIERILLDNEFCSENIKKALNFYNAIIKPELLAKYFTQKMGMSELVV